MRAIRSGGNRSTERFLRFRLVRSGIRGWQVRPKAVSGRPDFYFRRQRLAIFVDGCFWHGCPEHYALPRTRQDFWAAKLREITDRLEKH